MATPHEFFLATINRKIDMDGVPKSQPYQCVDLFKYWCKGQVGKSFGTLCPDTGYARDIWYCFDRLGLGAYFDKVPSNQMVDGDWAIMDFSKAYPYSHVAMFRVDNGNGTGVFLGQNQTSNPAVSQVNSTYTGVLGALRPKIYHQAPQPQSVSRKYVNLPGNVDSWAYYDVNDAPVKKNAKGTLNPKKFGGLSYTIREYRDNNTTVVIQGASGKLIKIYIQGTPAVITENTYKYGLVN